MSSKNRIKNIGVKLKINDMSFGYGNWDQWWGPGIHNSLVMSNNAIGMRHIFFGTDPYFDINDKYKFSFRFTQSDPMQNNAGEKYYLSAWYTSLRSSNLELGASQHILSGGYSDLSWNYLDALTVLIKKKNKRYWDNIFEYYLTMTFPSIGLKAFIEFGIPNRSYNSKRVKVILIRTHDNYSRKKTHKNP